MSDEDKRTRDDLLDELHNAAVDEWFGGHYAWRADLRDIGTILRDLEALGFQPTPLNGTLEPS